MHTLKELQTRIHNGIQQLNFSRPPSDLYDPITYTLDLGGKRLRPALCMLASDMFSDDADRALQVAIGIEVFHNFTLLHDDIMDQAPIRRGKPTVYKKWNINTAILSGDTMMALAYQYMMEAPENIRYDVIKIFSQTAIEVCEGQQYDMNFERQEHVIIAEYMEMIRLKTAVLLAASLKIGALIGGADKSEAEKLYSFGQNIGIAFQLKDDLLDVFSDEKKFGKATGGDILANKKTFLFLKACEVAPKETLLKLNKIFKSDKMNPADKINQVTQIYLQLDIKKIAEIEMDSYYQKGIANLNELNIPSANKRELLTFAQLLKLREF